jgi:hypothetical protein
MSLYNTTRCSLVKGSANAQTEEQLSMFPVSVQQTCRTFGATVCRTAMPRPSLLDTSAWGGPFCDEENSSSPTMETYHAATTHQHDLLQSRRDHLG